MLRWPVNWLPRMPRNDDSLDGDRDEMSETSSARTLSVDRCLQKLVLLQFQDDSRCGPG